MKQLIQIIIFCIVSSSLHSSQMNDLTPETLETNDYLDEEMWNIIQGNGSLWKLEKLFAQDITPDVNSINNGWTPLTYLARFRYSHRMSQWLIKHGADVNQPDEDGTTPIIAALQNSAINRDIIKLLIQNHANVNAQDDEGKTALIYAVDHTSYTHSYVDNIKLLISAGANPNIQDYEGRTALMQFIITNMNEKNNPIFETLIYNDIEIIQLLVAAGAEPNIQNEQDEDKRAIDYALPARRADIVQAIERGLKERMQYLERQKLAHQEIVIHLPPVLANIAQNYAFGQSPSDLPMSNTIISNCIVS